MSSPANTWFWSDTHAGHANIISFLRSDGVTRLRPEFWKEKEGDPKGWRDTGRMNQTMIDNFNSTVHPDDEVWFGGDVAFSLFDFNQFMSRLMPCRKYLIRGNHDTLDTPVYLKWFKGIYGTYEFKREGFILSHYPLHVSQLGSRAKVNVHGHIHANRVMIAERYAEVNYPDERYMNICVEHTNYGLVHMDEILQRVRQVSP